MQFPGYWVFGAGNKVWLIPHMFDETELSDVSQWEQAWENGETDHDGFVSHVPAALINNICDRVLLREPRFEEVEPSPHYKGEIILVETLEGLAAFIRRLELEDRRSRPGLLSISDDLPDDIETPL